MLLAVIHLTHLSSSCSSHSSSLHLDAELNRESIISSVEGKVIDHAIVTYITGNRLILEQAVNEKESVYTRENGPECHFILFVLRE